MMIKIHYEQVHVFCDHCPVWGDCATNLQTTKFVMLVWQILIYTHIREFGLVRDVIGSVMGTANPCACLSAVVMWPFSCKISLTIIWARLCCHSPRDFCQSKILWCVCIFQVSACKCRMLPTIVAHASLLFYWLFRTNCLNKSSTGSLWEWMISFQLRRNNFNCRHQCFSGVKLFIWIKDLFIWI